MGSTVHVSGAEYAQLLREALDYAKPRYAAEFEEKKRVDAENKEALEDYTYRLEMWVEREAKRRWWQRRGEVPTRPRRKFTNLYWTSVVNKILEFERALMSGGTYTLTLDDVQWLRKVSGKWDE